MKRIRSVTINGKRWLIDWRPMKTDWGTACPAEKRIEMNAGIKDNLTAATILIHEMLHGMWPDVEEDAISQRADELAVALHKARLIAEDE